MKKSIFGLPWSKIVRGVARLRGVIDAPAWLAMLKADDERLRLLGEEWRRIMLPAKPVVLPFEEPDSHKHARDIMGENRFHGILAAQKCFGPYTEQDLELHMPLRLCDVNGNPFTNSDEETLAVCRECKDTHIVVALKSLSLLDIHARCKSRMANDQNAPWFGEQRQHGWASQVIQGTWLLTRKEVVPDSWSKSQQAQLEHVQLTLPKERLTLPVEHTYAALLHQQETGEKLCPGYWIRFPVQAAGGGWVGADGGGGQLSVDYLDGSAGGDVASGSARVAS
jgi:hypothetical protein